MSKDQFGGTLIQQDEFGGHLVDGQQEVARKPGSMLLGDLGASLKSGVEQIPGMVTGLADIVPALVANVRPFSKAADALGEVTGFQPGKWAKEVQHSQDYQDVQRASGDQYKDIEATIADPNKSKMDVAGSILKSAPNIAGFYAKNPGYVLNQVAESAPSMLAGGVASKGIRAAGRATGLIAGDGAGASGLLSKEAGDAAAAGLGEGTVQAGQQMDQGSELADQRANAIAALGSGLGDAVIAGGAGRLANKLGLETAETAMVKAGDKGASLLGDAASPGMLKRLAGGMASEGILQEFPQSMQEQVWQNYAEGKPLSQGVLQQGIEGGLAGAVMGAGANIRGHKAAAPVATPSDQDLNAANADLGKAVNEYTGMPDGQSLLGYNNVITPPNASGQGGGLPRSIVEVPRQDGQGTTTIDRATGPLSDAAADAVESGLTSAAAMQSSAILKAYQTSQDAQAEIDGRADGQRLQIIRHPRVSDRFAVVPKNAQALKSMDDKESLAAQNLARTQQLEQEDGNAALPVAQVAPTTVEGALAQSVDEAAHRAATSPNNGLSEPTDAQKKAGNYQKGHVTIGGLKISMENPVGSTRSGVDGKGKPWSVTMADHYGYVKGTVGADGDHVDVFVKAGTPLNHSGDVFVVDQKNPATGKFDEHKAMIGYPDAAAALAAYKANYSKGWKGAQAVVAMPLQQFKAWVNDGEKSKPVAQALEDERTQNAQAESMQEELQAPVTQAAASMPGIAKMSEKMAAAARTAALNRAASLATEEAIPAEPKKVAQRKDKTATDPNAQQTAQAAADEAAQAEVAQSTGKSSQPRLARNPGESNDAYMARRAAQANKQRAERGQQQDLPTAERDVAAVREATGQPEADVSIAQAKDLPDASKAEKGKLSRQGAEFIQHVAKVFGQRVVFVKGMSADGFLKSGNTIYLNTDSSVHQLRVLGHEMTHAMKAQSRKSYNHMMDAVKSLLTDDELMAQHKDYFGEDLADVADLDKVSEKTGGQTMRDFLAEEWMSDLGGNRFAEASFWDDVFKQIESKHGSESAKGIIAKLRMAFLNALSKVMAAIKGNSFAVDERMAEHLEQVRKAVAEGFASYAQDVKNNQLQGDDGVTKFARKPIDVGGFQTIQNKDGSMTVKGDPDAIRALLPEGIIGRVTKEGIAFTHSDAPRARHALEGNKTAYSRAGTVTEQLVRNADGTYLGAPEKFNTPGKIPYLRKWLMKLTKEGEAGRFWYENSSRAVLRMVGGDVQEARKFVALLAIYSPQAKVDTNSTFALRAWAQYKAGQPISVKTGVMDSKAQRALDNVDEFWKGEKTGNFFTNLLTEIDPSLKGKQGATIDMWMMRAAQYGNDAPTKTQYAFMENETNRIARELGWEPQQVQAAIWVAMKARMENEKVKKDTEAKSEKKGWIHYVYPLKNGNPSKTRIVDKDQEHRDNWLDHAIAHDPSTSDTQRAKFDFEDGVQRHIGQISFEARPGRSTGVLPGVHAAPYSEQLEFQNAVQKTFYDDEGKDMLASMLGLLEDSNVVVPGVWQGEVSPSNQKQVAMAPSKGDDGKSSVDPSQKKALDVYAAVAGLVTKQEGVGWHRPFYATSKAKANGIDIDLGKPISPEQAKALSAAISQWMEANGKPESWNNDLALISSPNGIRITNFGIITNEQLHNDLIGVAESALPDFDYRAFASDGNMPSNNWKENPDGQSYVQGISAAGRSDVLDWARDFLAPRVQSVFDEYSKKYNWGDPGSIKFSPQRTGDGSGRQEPGRAASGSLQASERAVPQKDLSPLPGAPNVPGFHGPDPALVSVAETYARKIGIQLARQAEYVQIDPVRAKRIADAYEAMPHAPQDPKVKEAYQNLIRQTVAQYQALVDSGYKFWLMDMAKTSNQEYASTPWNAMRDIRENKSMGVFPTEDGFGSSESFDPTNNPLLEDTGIMWPSGSLNGPLKRVLANDLFRAVHDAFGHGLEGSGFRAQGEENAWQAHSRLFTGSALGAITSETRGQNSWLNFGPHGESNQKAKVEDTVFADQKTGLMPSWTWTEGVADNAKYGIQFDGSEDFPTAKLSTSRDEQRGVHGAGGRVARAHAVDLRGIHFSAQQREVLNGGFFGTGLKGAELGRLSEAKDERIKQRVYFYVDEGRGITPESGTGGVAHAADISNLYNVDGDPLKLFKSSDLNGSESRVLDAGYNGYYYPNYVNGQGIAIVMGDAAAAIKVDQTTFTNGRPPAAIPVPYKRGLTSKELNAIDMPALQVVAPSAKLRAGTLSIDASEVDAARAALAKQGIDVPDVKMSTARQPFYSALSKEVGAIKMTVAPGFGWRDAIKGMVNKGLIKADEVEWTGINDWLALQQGKVTKEQVQAYLDANGVQVQEVTLGKERFKTPTEAIAALAKDKGMTEDEVRENWGYANERDYITLANADIDDEGGSDGTKYGQYTMHGGENYREVLLTLPDGRKAAPEQAERMKVVKREDGNWDVMDKDGVVKSFREWGDASGYAYDQQQSENIKRNLEWQRKQPPVYQSSHWDAPNVLAHIRVNDRTDADGSKVLFVEEVQSDWGQEGKKKGITKHYKLADLTPAAHTQSAWVIDAKEDGGNQTFNILKSKAATEQGAMDYIVRNKTYGGSIPNAPFIGGTQGWLNLALKRIITMAVDGGYDKVAFIDGKQSADRYDLSKSISKVLWNEDTSRLTAWDKNVSERRRDGRTVIDESNVTASRLEDFIGKDAAQKLISQEMDDEGDRSLSGLDLKVGGEGMKAFYDSIVPNAVKALLKKVGGGQLQTVQMGYDPNPELDSWEPEDGQGDGSKGEVMKFSQPGFDVTDAMREKAAGGLPQFSQKRIVGDQGRAYTPDQLKAMANVGFQVEVPTIKERAKAIWKDAGKRLAQGLADQFAPIKDIDSTAYGLMRLAKGAAGSFEALLKGGMLKLTDNVYDFDDKKRGGVIDRLLTPLGLEHHDFFRWIAANRAERLLGEGKETLFTPADIAALKTLNQGTVSFDYTIQNGPRAGQTTRNRAEIYRDSLTTFNQFNTNVLDMAEQSGLIDGASRHMWEHEFYVPFYRVADEEGGVTNVGTKGAAIRQQAFKALKGGKDKLNVDLLDNTLMNWAHLLDASAKNRAAKATLEAAERVGIATGGNQSTLESMASSMGIKSGVVWFMDGGKKRYSLIDNQGDGRYLMTAISSLEYAGMRNPAMNAMGAMKHALTVGITASPFFKVRNLIRDSVQAIGTGPLSYNVGKNLVDGWKRTDLKSDEYFRLLAGGGTIHFGTMMEGSEAKRVQALVESGVDAATILNNHTKAQAFYRKVIEPAMTAYSELGNRGEAINRAALYHQLVSQGASHAEASLQARDLMDFSMQGSFTSVRFLTQVVPFMNARIQGLYKLGKAAKEDPARFATVLGATALFSLMLLAAYHDDDDWKKRSDADRNNFWWFKFGGVAYRIPKPFEIGSMGTLAERGFELAFEKEMTSKRFMGQVLALLSDNLSMNPIPQLVKPMLDVYANTDSFTGNPIENMAQQKLKSEYRFNDRTSMAARGASTAMNAVTGTMGKEALSPVQIDHMLQGYFGWLGTFVVSGADVLARPATSQPTQATPDYMKVVTGNMASQLQDAPSRYVGQLYTQFKELQQSYDTWKLLQKEGKVEEAKQFFDANREDILKYPRTENAKRSETLFNNMLRMVERNAAMSADEKRTRIRDISAMKDRVARTVN